MTRPRERAAGLVLAIERAGGIAVRFPVIEIEPLESSVGTGDGPDHDVIVFVSPAAVAHGVSAVVPRQWGPSALAAVGQATARALRDAGHEVDIEPVGSEDSEGLLRAPALARARVSGRRVLIVRGEGGREHLAQSLMARGAAVDYAEVYRRRRPVGLEPALATGCDIVTATSVEGLANLLAVLDQGSRKTVLKRPIAVNSQRLAVRARTSGFERMPCVASTPGDSGLLEAIRRCAAALPHRDHRSLHD